MKKETWNTSNKDKKYTKAEEENILNDFLMFGLSIDKIAKKYKRTLFAITTKLVFLLNKHTKEARNTLFDTLNKPFCPHCKKILTKTEINKITRKAKK